MIIRAVPSLIRHKLLVSDTQMKRCLFAILLVSLLLLSGYGSYIGSASGYANPSDSGEADFDYFQGTLYYDLDINGSKQELRYLIKRNLIRLEIDDPVMGGSITLLMAQDHDEVVILMHEVGGYSRFALQELAHRGEALIEQVDRFAATGNEQMVSDVLIREYVIHTDGDEDVVLWSPVDASRYGYFQFPDFGDPALSRLLKHDIPAGFFPFLVFYEGKETKISIRLYDIVEETLAPELFEVPASYRDIPVNVPDY